MNVLTVLGVPVPTFKYDEGVICVCNESDKCRPVRLIHPISICP